jgi:SpoVK/Ycf46/Vps4 family AAA+-type ATPase
VARRSGRAFIALTPSTLLSKWAGEAERSLRRAFAAAALHAPALVFIDELDALAASRGGGGDEDAGGRRLLAELLLLLTQHCSGGGGICVVGCTNRVADLDPALLRRFDVTILCPLPSAQHRATLLVSLLRDVEVAFALPALVRAPRVGGLAALLGDAIVAALRVREDADEDGEEEGYREKGNAHPSGEPGQYIGRLRSEDIVRDSAPECRSQSLAAWTLHKDD